MQHSIYVQTIQFQIQNFKTFIFHDLQKAGSWVFLGERMRKLQIYIVPRRNIVTTWMKLMEIFCIYTEIDTMIGREQSWVDVRDLSDMV